MDFFNNIANQLQQIDYSLITKIASPIFIYYISNTTYKSYKPHKDAKVKKDTTIMLPPDIVRKPSEVDKEKIVKQKFGAEIINFCSIISNNVQNDNLGLFYNNINNLATYTLDFRITNFLFDKSLHAYYMPEDNKIVAKKYDYNLAIDHELFHMSSSYYDKNKLIWFSGFSQKAFKRNTIGVGINEGYTQLLTERYFGNNKKLLESYTFEKKISKKLELIIGKLKMESLYFKADLYNLVEQLKQYNEESNIINFINDVDFLSKHISKGYRLPMDKSIIASKLRSVNSFLLKSYLKKLDIELKNNLITQNILQEKLQEFISLITTSILNGKIKYKVFDKREIEKMLFDSTNELQMNFEIDSKPITK